MSWWTAEVAVAAAAAILVWRRPFWGVVERHPTLGIALLASWGMWFAGRHLVGEAIGGPAVALFAASVALGIALHHLEPLPAIVVGGIYTTRRADGRYGISKILAHEPGIVHLRMYRNVFDEKPSTIEPTELTIDMTLEDLEKLAEPHMVLGIGHAPVDEKGFLRGRPTLIATVPVTAEELDWSAAGA